jgi:uncharacterized protein YjdB
MSTSGRTLATMAVVALTSWSCGSTAPDATPNVATIVVTPATSTLALNTRVPLQAQVQDESGAAVADAAVTWTVQNPRIVSVSPDGVVTALAAGTSKVAANALGKSGIATITVTPTPVTPPPVTPVTPNSQGGVVRIDVSPATLSVQAGQTQQLVASPKDAKGNTITGQTVVWGSDNSAVATVNGGHVTTSKSGVATITASVGGVKGTASVTVYPGAAASVTVTAPSKNLKAGSTMQLTATATDNQGNAVPNQSFFWSSSATNIATVSASGVVSGKRKGNVSISAQTSGGKSGSLKINVK